jgi:hypothetical protein
MDADLVEGGHGDDGREKLQTIPIPLSGTPVISAYVLIDEYSSTPIVILSVAKDLPTGGAKYGQDPSLRSG